MKKSELIKLIREELQKISTPNVDEKVIEFLKNHPSGIIPDEHVHKLVDELQISPHDLESKFYKIAADAVNKKAISLDENISPSVLADELVKAGVIKNEYTDLSGKRASSNLGFIIMDILKNNE